MKLSGFKNILKNEDGVPEVSPLELNQNLETVKIVDVRRPDEYTGELGHINGAQLLTLEKDFNERIHDFDKNDCIVFVCRSGARSARATQYAQTLGFKEVYNMHGGMILWNELGLPKE